MVPACDFTDWLKLWRVTSHVIIIIIIMKGAFSNIYLAILFVSVTYISATERQCRKISSNVNSVFFLDSCKHELYLNARHISDWQHSITVNMNASNCELALTRTCLAMLKAPRKSDVADGRWSITSWEPSTRKDGIRGGTKTLQITTSLPPKIWRNYMHIEEKRNMAHRLVDWWPSYRQSNCRGV